MLWHGISCVLAMPLMQTSRDVTEEFRYVCNNSVKHTMCLGHNRLWYAFATNGNVVTLPAGSQQGLGMGPSLHWHGSNGWYWSAGWSRQYPVTDSAQEAKVEKNTAVQAYQYLRDICNWWLLNHDAPLMLHEWTGCCCTHWQVSFLLLCSQLETTNFQKAVTWLCTACAGYVMWHVIKKFGSGL